MSDRGRLTFAGVMLRSLRFHYRAHLLLVLALAIAIAVLAGALVVGWSLQHTLKSTLRERLGSAREVITLQRPATAGVSARIGNGVGEATQLRASATNAEETVLPIPSTVWAVSLTNAPDGWNVPPLADDQAVLNEALARDLGVAEGDEVIVRLDVSATRPGVGLFAYRDVSQVTRLERLTVKQVVPTGQWADFSLAQTQVAPRNIFVSPSLVGLGPNHLIASRTGALDPSALHPALSLQDLGLRERESTAGVLLQSDTVVFADSQQQAIESAVSARPYGTYIARTLRHGERHVSYGLIAAELAKDDSLAREEIVLNRWVADDLGVAASDTIEFETLIANEDGSYLSRKHEMRVAGVKEIGHALFVPETTTEVQGLTSAQRMDDWEAPFPVDMPHVTQRDEAYWEQHRATPKAIISRHLMEELWRDSGYVGRSPVTGYILPALDEKTEAAIRSAILERDPQWHAVDPSLAAQRASRGSADFAMLFVGMSAFLIFAAILAAASLARLGAQARLADAGLASALGVARRRWLLMVLSEYVLVVVPGVAIGVVLGVLYAVGLLSLFESLSSSVWEMPAIRLDVRPISLILSGIFVGVLTLAVAAWQLRSELRRPVRELMSSIREHRPARSQKRGSLGTWALGALVVLIAFILLSQAGRIPPVAGFFIVATVTIVSAYALLRMALRAAPATSAGLTMRQLYMRFLQGESRRAQLTFALFTVGAFVLCAVALFRGAAAVPDPTDPHGPTGGFSFRITSPLMYRASLETAQGQETAGIQLPPDTKVVSLLTSNGTEAGCLNLAVPGEMQLLGVPDSFIDRDGFDVNTASDAANPWTLLQNRADPIPVFGDEETMLWIEYRRLGDVFTVPVNGVQRNLQLVGMIRGGLFSGQLLMSADNLRRILPDARYGMHLVDSPPTDELRAELTKLADIGMTLERTTDVIAQVHSVQTLYMTLFLALGGLGLLLGAVGSLVLMVRDVNERRGELSLLLALGLSDNQVSRVLLVWHVLPLCGGLLTGLAAAILGYVTMNRQMGLTLAVAVGLGALVVVLLMMWILARRMRPRQISNALRTAA